MYLTEKELARFIGQFQMLDYTNFQIYLVNNNLKNYWFMKMKKKYPEIFFINAGKNIGFSQGVNLALKKIIQKDFDYTLLLNPDTTFEKKLLKSLIFCFNEHKKAGLMSPIILQADNRIWYAGGILNLFWGFTQSLNINKKFSEIAEGAIITGPTEIISGCCVMVKSEVWQKIGLLEKDYFMYFDDPDLSLRAKKNNFDCFLLAKPLIFHKKRSGRLSPLEAYFFGRNPFIMIKKLFPWYFKPTAYLGQFLIRLPRNVLRAKNIESIKKYFQGISDGLKGLTGKPSWLKE
jgi:hypothetical protein